MCSLLNKLLLMNDEVCTKRISLFAVRCLHRAARIVQSFFIVFRLLRISRGDQARTDTSGGRDGQVRIPQLHQKSRPQREDRVSLRQGIPARWSCSCDLCQRTVESTWIAHLKYTWITHLNFICIAYIAPPGLSTSSPPGLPRGSLPGLPT